MSSVEPSSETITSHGSSDCVKTDVSAARIVPAAW
jgi:hypothetical protein